MYKVFIYDKPVYITSKQDFEVKNCQQLTQLNVDKILALLEKKEVHGVIVSGSDEKKLWEEFKSNFKYIEAAGGTVFNSEEELLLIHRLGKWDLPKGKREKNEGIQDCAVREVEEECNVNSLEIVKELNSTYHCYPHKGSWALKRTYWFVMRTTFQGELIPQTEEGIDQVIWLPMNQLSGVFSDTYSSIIEVLEQVQ